ncbi:carbohydrate ABC transporter permease [Leadbettera azotonutricia]|uniref:sn-glycerol-3-phosphate transport system permease protein UgpE n=1 Tax=Leadbettera azotonutricia (strain ATCC BAA-888 / DSM 13862 / ZAS-9) TaxID=545695 RepID=F5YF77_LEAAZ|nr:carbohydrate ABC transporter permease [Leadbettera azotonutricia]AEF80337.1 sugar permease [Leadbettera azotonutricia ZAS-9]
MNRRERRRFFLDWVASITALVLGFIIIFPIIYTICVAFKTRAELSVFPPALLPDSFLNMGNFKSVFETAPLMRFMANSVIVSGLGCSLRILFAVLAAYAFSYFKFPLRNLLFMVVLATMMLPADTLIVTNYLTITRLNMLDNYLGMCITSLVGASQMFMLRQNFKTIPQSLRDAAFIDGCGDLRYLTRVVAPLSSPVIFTLMVQSFINFWNAYLWPLLVTNKAEMRTVQIGIAMLTNPLDTNYTLVLAAVAILLIPSLFLFSFLRLAMVRGIAAGALVG